MRRRENIAPPSYNDSINQAFLFSSFAPVLSCISPSGGLEGGDAERSEVGRTPAAIREALWYVIRPSRRDDPSRLIRIFVSSAISYQTQHTKYNFRPNHGLYDNDGVLMVDMSKRSPSGL